MPLLFGESTHLHHAQLGAGAGLTRDGLDDGRAAVRVVRHDLQEEGLEGGNGWKSNTHDNADNKDQCVGRTNQCRGPSV